jgi:endoglucanase
VLVGRRRDGSGWLRAVGALTLAIAVVALAAAGAASARRPHAAGSAQQRCADRYPAKRTASNPLDLPQAPGANPLHGASFFVPGPAHGEAAQAIVSLTGIQPTSAVQTWGAYRAGLHHGAAARRLSANRSLAHKVGELIKIANQPEAQRFSSFIGGGAKGAVFSQVQKVFCDNLVSDPHSIPIINTDFMHGDLGACPTAAQVRKDRPTFQQRIDEMAEGTARRPAVYLLELGAVGSSTCLAAKGALPAWEGDLRYEINRISALPHTVVYVEAGYSDSNTVAYTAKVLNAVGVRNVRGFFTNDTHLNWTIDEVRWAQRVSARTGGAHFVVNTADNGRGPLLNPHPRTQGIENLCNPSGRGLGPKDTTDTSFGAADAFLWTHPPGNSSGCGGGPPAGVFWPQRAIAMAQRANGRLGPSYPSKPY